MPIIDRVVYMPEEESQEEQLSQSLLSQILEQDNEITEIFEEGTDDIPDTYPTVLPILPIRNTVLFPGVVMPITVNRDRAVKLVRRVYAQELRLLGVVSQKDAQETDPALDDLHTVGTVARLVKLLVMPDETVTIIIQGKQRFDLLGPNDEETAFLSARVSYLPDTEDSDSQEEEALYDSIKEMALRIIDLNPDIPDEAKVAIENIERPAFMVNFLCANLNISMEERQTLLETDPLQRRAILLLEHMSREVQLLQIKRDITSKTHSDIDQQQRDFFLRQQIRTLQDELGEITPDQEIEHLLERAQDKNWTQTAADHFGKELQRLRRMNPAAPDYSISLNYLEFMLDLPWQDYTDDILDLKKAQKILDKDHYGLEKVKTRILEYLAVVKLRQDMRGPILCLYGPPGVGKTSLGQSIARAMGRKYSRISLGGVRDEAEIRGHRRTYIGAMPGRILQNIKKVGASNPVMVLDEVDKVGSDFRGDPSSALLEVLDPEQNHSFADHYLDVEYDLSKVFFIATANSLDTIQPALRDRMEIIEITGYTQEEKLEIAKKYLVPKQRQQHGLQAEDIKLSDAVLRLLIQSYTRESGVRKLEQQIAALMRHTAKNLAMQEPYNKRPRLDDIPKILGIPVYDEERYDEEDVAGLVTGLAWTPFGGDILFIESSLSRGKGRLTLSGQLGDVMKESATTALSYLKSHAEELGIDYRLFEKYDLHIHVPAGAVPKDGPSAGITLLTSIASLCTQRKVKGHLAMTGEITLRGKVLPVGGIKEKLLAARRAGIKYLIFSVRNRKQVEEVESRYREGLEIHYVDQVKDVLKIALLPEKVSQPMTFVLD
ncbi:MAG: endopeptidase La [Bernardetiaceae bacterium]